MPTSAPDEADREDEEEERKGGGPTRIWHVRFEGGEGGGTAPTVTELAERPLKQSMLPTDDACVLELSGSVWVWMGRGANKAEPVWAAMQTALSAQPHAGRSSRTESVSRSIAILLNF